MSTNRRTRGFTKSGEQRQRTLSAWRPHWANECGARNVCQATTTNYLKALDKLTRFLGDVEPQDVKPDDLRAWQSHMLTVEKLKATTANHYLLTAGTFFNWLVDERVIGSSPVLEVKLSRAPQQDPPVLDRAIQRAVVRAAARTKKGRTSFEALRNQAVLLLLQDTGLRVSELSGLLLDNLNTEYRQARVLGKGGRWRVVPYGFETARVVARYLRAREDQPGAFLPQVFIGRGGPLTSTSVRRMMKKAGLDASAVGVRPHLYRHTWAHNMKTAGYDLEVLMSLGGWSSVTMPLRYARSARDSRALDAYQRLGSPVDREKLTRPDAESSRKRKGNRGSFPAGHATEGW